MMDFLQFFNTDIFPFIFLATVGIFCWWINSLYDKIEFQEGKIQELLENWIYWPGGEWKHEPERRVDILCRSGQRRYGICAIPQNWKHNKRSSPFYDYDIVAFRFC